MERLLKRGADGRLKRIEYRGRHLRASRTGGLALRAQTRGAGLNLTGNTSHGVRVSSRIGKGTQAAFQNGRFILRGRYGRGPNKLNLSKSGLSVSTETGLGTVNWFKPGYSSAKIGGIQVRGKKAAYAHLVLAVFQLIAYLAVFLFQALVLSAQALWWLGLRAVRGARRLGDLRHRSAMRSAENAWLAELEPLAPETLREAMKAVFLRLAAGQPIGAGSVRGEAHAATPESGGRSAEALVARLLGETSLPAPRDLEVLFGCLAETHARKTANGPAGDGEPDAAARFFLDLDEAAASGEGRTRLQERLLATYADVCGITVGETGAP